MRPGIVGVGMTRFTKQEDRRPEEIAGEAVRAAVRDAGLGPEDVQAAFCGNVQLGMGVGQSALRELGMTGIPITNVENACASGGSAIREAVAWLQSGAAEVVLAFGVEKLTQTAAGMLDMGRASLSEEVGLPLPGAYALKARRHMDLYGLTREQLASVSVKNRANGSRNPYAHFRSPVTVEEVLQSAPITDPITLFQCTPNVDGAAAVVLSTEERARDLVSKPVYIAGFGMASGNPVDETGTEGDTVSRAAKAAYESSSLGPEDVDVCELHEPFTITEINNIESLGFCEKGSGGEYVEGGRADINGPGVAVNPSGGLLSRGHPLGATGIAQVVELTWQLRGEAGDRQQDGARVGLAQIMGGNVIELDGNACLVHVLTN